MTEILNKNYLKDVYQTDDITHNDIKCIGELELSINELREDTRLFKNLKTYVEYMYLNFDDMTAILGLVYYMVENKEETMKLSDVLLESNTKQLDNGKVLLLFGG